MTTTDLSRRHAPGLPHPDYDAELYRDVPVKRFFAWIADVILISALTAVLTFFSLFTALFFLPLLYLATSFLYRWITIAGGSATPGMRLFAIEIRQSDGARMDGGAAFLHTLGYFVSVAAFPLQLVSILLMLVSARRQGLTDMLLGTAAINRRAR